MIKIKSNSKSRTFKVDGYEFPTLKQALRYIRLNGITTYRINFK